MNVRNSASITAAGLVVVLVVAACGGSDATATPPSTTAPLSSSGTTPALADQEYFQQVREANALFAQNFEKFAAIFGQTWPLRERLIAALKEAGVGTAFTSTVEALEKIHPPQEHRVDHDILLAMTQELLRLDGEAAAAIEDGDLVRFGIINGQMGEQSSLQLTRLSGVYCNALADPGSIANSQCNPLNPLPGGNYGADLNGYLRQFVPRLSSAIGVLAFSLSLTPEELEQGFRVQVPKIISLFSEAEDRLQQMTPPSEFQADHNRLVSFMGENLRFNEANAGAALRDPLAFRSAESRFFEGVCQLRQNLSSDDFGGVVAPLFPGPGGIGCDQRPSR